jgi:hypothetical protein
VFISRLCSCACTAAQPHGSDGARCAFSRTPLLKLELSEEEERVLAELRRTEAEAKMRAEVAAREAGREFVAADDALTAGRYRDAAAAFLRAAAVGDAHAAERAVGGILDAGQRALDAGCLEDAVAVLTEGVATFPGRGGMVSCQLAEATERQMDCVDAARFG